MNEAGRVVTQIKAESKSKSRVKSHKNIVDSKHQTEGKRTIVLSFPGIDQYSKL